MNQAEIAAAAVEHFLPASRLLMCAELLATGTEPRALAAILETYHPANARTVGGQLVSDERGITGTSPDGVRRNRVTWDEFARHLANVLTAARGRELADAYQAAAKGGAEAAERLAGVRSLFACALIDAAEFAQPSILGGDVADRVVIDGTLSDGFQGRVTMHSIGDRQAACCVNGQVVLTLRATPDAERVYVLYTARGLSVALDQQAMFSGTVRHVPPGDRAGPLPATFAERVGIDVFNDGPEGAAWALQVDGFDVAVMEADAGWRPGVSVVIYDDDPAQPFRRFEATTIVGALPPPRSVGAAAARLDQLTRVPSPGPPLPREP